MCASGTFTHGTPGAAQAAVLARNECLSLLVACGQFSLSLSALQRQRRSSSRRFVRPDLCASRCALHRVEPVRVTHSIPDCCGLILRSEEGTIVHSGMRLAGAALCTGREVHRATLCTGCEAQRGCTVHWAWQLGRAPLCALLLRWPHRHMMGGDLLFYLMASGTPRVIRG